MCDPEELLPLSGLQHFAFCRRQWALIHLENQWAESARTVEGAILHRTAHDAEQTEARGDLLILRGLRVYSLRLGLGGVCDVVEFRRSPQGVPLRGREGLWLPTPVEYKRGRPKEDDRDEVQLCGQALCLEDMLACSIPQAFLYYGEPRRRQTVPLTDELRKRVLDIAAEMRALSARGYTPSVRPSKACNACSLKEICLPHLSRSGSVAAYIHARAGEEP